MPPQVSRHSTDVQTRVFLQCCCRGFLAAAGWVFESIIHRLLFVVISAKVDVTEQPRSASAVV